MLLGGILAGLVAASVFFASRWLSSSIRERISLSSLASGATCVSTAGFLVNAALGFLATGALIVLFGILLGYESGE